MAGLLLARDNIDFLLHDWLKVEDLTTRERYADHSRETFDATLDLCEALATDHFAPHNKKADANEPRFENGKVVMIPETAAALRKFGAAGLFAAHADYDLGGMQLPATVHSACFAFFKAANTGTAAYAMLTTAAANLLRKHGTPDQVKRFVEPMLAGRFFGTMCLSEPQAGSSLGDITTRAEPQADGSYRLFGTKMWISGGEHEMSETIVHMVLAKVQGGTNPGGPGVRGISLFVVPKHLVADNGTIGERNDIVLAGLNHKMGYRGTTNTLLNFGEGQHRPQGEAGAIGWLVGTLHQGLPAMFHMMNEARIGVGLGATALGYTGYLHALAYAKDRPQGRPIGAKDAKAKQVRIIEHPDVRRMLLAQKAYVEGAFAFALYCSRLVDEERTGAPEAAREANALLDLLTPIAKSWPSQYCLAANDLAIQVHGGYGYTRDYNVEQFYRDNRLNAIHEGTHGIQALDLLGRKVSQNGGEGFALLQARIGATIAASAGAAVSAYGRELQAALDAIGAVTGTLHSSGDPVLTLANASAYLEAFGHMVMAWIWLEQCLAARDRHDDFGEGKRQACRWFFRWELPTIYPRIDALGALDRTTLDMAEGWF